MSWWSRRKDDRARVAEARKALSETVGELQEARTAKQEAAATAEQFKQRAVTLREIRLRNHITPSLFPGEGTAR